MKNQRLIKSGYLIPILFWTTTLICGFLMPGYNHATSMVSELGEMGSETRYLFTIGLVITSIISVFFNISLYKTCKKAGLNVIPVLILWTFSFSIFGAGLFPFPLRLHGLLGSPSMILFLSPLAALVFWKTEVISNIKVVSLLMLLLMSLGFLVLAPDILTEYFGIKQRLFHLGWTVWFLYLTSIFIGVDKRAPASAQLNRVPMT